MAAEMELAVTSGRVPLVSTALGVYLAARAANKNTVEFEAVRAGREGYFMPAALLDDFRENGAAVDRSSGEFQVHLNEDPAHAARPCPLCTCR